LPFPGVWSFSKVLTWENETEAKRKKIGIIRRVFIVAED
jgi:hypothetical protein